MEGSFSAGGEGDGSGGNARDGERRGGTGSDRCCSPPAVRQGLGTPGFEDRKIVS